MNWRNDNMFQPKFPNLDELQEKWLGKNEDLDAKEISALFGMVEAKNDRLKAIKDIVNSPTMSTHAKVFAIVELTENY